ncbi:MAG: hypothetical protein IKU65_00235 [Oscillospiraceae bacterium]|nr:hypothetical protein [Oscillospiraceae bacterium]
MKKLRDYFWIWGHPTNCLYNGFGITKESDMAPVAGTKYLGAKNVFLVPMSYPVDKIEESKLATELNEFGWSINFAHSEPENVTEICDLKKQFPTLTKAAWDDFFSPGNPKNNYTNYTPELLAKFREQLHEAGIEMWMVLYTENFRELDIVTIQKFVNEFDGISLWFWNEQEVIDDYEYYVDLFFHITKNKKRMIGCYLFDFGAEQPATSKAVIYQLEREREMIREGLIEGVILHTNAVVAKEDPYEAVEAGKEWMMANGDEIIE